MVLAENYATAVQSGGFQYGFFNLLKQLTAAEQKQVSMCLWSISKAINGFVGLKTLNPNMNQCGRKLESLKL
jgi:hypothetical protein